MTVNKENLLNNAVFFFFALFLFSSSFSIALSQTSFGLALFFFILMVVTSRYSPFPAELKIFYLCVVLFLIWMMLSSLINGAPLRNLKEEWLFLIIPVGIYLFRQRHYRAVLVVSLAAGVILASVYGIAQHFTGVNWFKDYPLPPARDNTFYAAGAFSNSLTYGNYLAVSAMFLISFALLKGKQSLGALYSIVIASGALAVIATVMSYSRTAVAALPIGLLLMTWLKGRRWAVISTLVLIVVATLTFLLVGQLAFKYKLAFEEDLAGEQESSRLFIWKKSLAIISDNPIFGVGQGNFEQKYSGYLDSAKNETRTRPHAHNDILNFAAVAGIPGGLLFISIWCVWFYKLHKLWHNSQAWSDKKIFAGAAVVAGAAFLVTSATEATFADEEVRQLLMVIWSAGLWPLMSKKTDDESPEIESA
jgi:O-antigen ligase